MEGGISGGLWQSQWVLATARGVFLCPLKIHNEPWRPLRRVAYAPGNPTLSQAWRPGRVGFLRRRVGWIGCRAMGRRRSRNTRRTHRTRRWIFWLPRYGTAWNAVV